MTPDHPIIVALRTSVLMVVRVACEKCGVVPHSMVIVAQSRVDNEMGRRVLGVMAGTLMVHGYHSTRTTVKLRGKRKKGYSSCTINPRLFCTLSLSCGAYRVDYGLIL